MNLREENKIVEKISKSNTLWAYLGNLDAEATVNEVVYGILPDLYVEAERDLGECVMQAYCDGMGKNLTGDDYVCGLVDEVEKWAQVWSDECQQEKYGREDGYWQYDEDQEIGRYGR